MKNVKKNLTFLVFVAGMVYGQTTTTQSTPPLGLSATGNCSQLQQAATLTIRNSSSQPVLAYVIHVSKFCIERNELERHDFFFKDQAFLPGATFTKQLGVPGTESQTAQVSGAPLEATVLFVQFADGTTYGDQTVGKALLSQRQDVVTFLQQLQAASNDQQTFSSILSQQQTPSTSLWVVSQHLNMIMVDSGMQAVVADVNKRLQVAQQRQNIMN